MCLRAWSGRQRRRAQSPRPWLAYRLILHVGLLQLLRPVAGFAAPLAPSSTWADRGPGLRGHEARTRCGGRARESLWALRCSTTASVSPDVVKKYKKLQNQSDVRGVSLPGVPDEAVTLSPTEAYCVGVAFAQWLKEQQGDNQGRRLRVSVGRDPRLSGPALCQALMGGLTSEGLCQVADFGLCTTPAMFKSCVTPGHDCDGAVMITASHLPSNRNGLKFFTKEGGLNKANIADIVGKAAEAHARKEEEASVKGPNPDLAEQVDFLPVYIEQLKDMIIRKVNKPGADHWKPLQGFKLVVNAGNGMGGFLRDMLEDLGADTTGSLHLEPDGTFPNHLANPELPEAMEATIAAVKGAGADLGIIVDTDVDRSGVCDRRGVALNRNRLIALMAVMVLRDYPGTTIVTDSVTSNGVKRFIEARGGHHLRYKKGYKNVIDKSIDLNNHGMDSQLAIETSGHAALKENQMLDDGAYLAMKILVEMARLGRGKDIGDLIKDLKEPMEEKEFRLKVRPGLDTAEVFEQTLASLQAAVERVGHWRAEQENYEGLRVSVNEGEGRAGWVMNRMSLHDPIVIFNIESECEGGVAATARKLLAEALAGPSPDGRLNFPEDLDLSPLHDWVAAAAQ